MTLEQLSEQVDKLEKLQNEIQKQINKVVKQLDKVIEQGKNVESIKDEVQLANRIEQALALKKQGYIDAIQDRIKTERSAEGRD